MKFLRRPADIVMARYIMCGRDKTFVILGSQG